MPTGAGKSAGRVSVRVVPDSTAFRTELKADLDKIERGLQVTVKAALDDAGLKASLEKLQQTKIDLQATVSTAQVREQIASVSKAGGKINLPVGLSGEKVVKLELIRLATDKVVDIVLRINKASLVAVGSALASLSGGKGAVGYLRQIGSALGGLDKSIPKISAVALGVGSIGALGLSSVQGLLSLASSLVSVAGAGLAVPGILAGIGLAGGTLAVALSTAKTELAGLVPTLKSFQTAIGGAFFAKAKGPIEDLVKTVTGGLRPAFSGLSSALGSFAGDLARSLVGAVKLGIVGEIFKNVTSAINTARAGITPLVSAFSVLAGVGASFLPALAKGFVDLSKQFDNFISTAAGDGSLDNWINSGIAGLKSLASVVGSVVGIVKGLFDAANAGTGGNGLAVFAGALKQVSAAVNSSGLQSALSTIFSGASAGAAGLATAIKPIGGLLQSLAPTLAGVFKTAGTVVGGALSAIAKALQSPAFASGLTAFFNGIAAGVAAVLPVLPQIVSALSTVATTAGLVAAQLGPVFAASFAALAPVITQVLTALQPLIPVLGSALVNSVSILAAALTVLAPIFSAIITAVAPLIPILAGALAGALATLGPAVLAVVQAIGGSLPAVIAAIASTVDVLAPVLAQVITALAPLIPAILSLIPPLLQIATAILPLIPAVIAAIVPLVLQLVPLFLQILTAILPLVPSIVQLVAAAIPLAQVFQGIIPALTAVVAVIPTVVAGLQGLLGIVTGFVQGAVALFSGNFAAIPGIISGIFGAVQGVFASGLAGPAGLIQAFVGRALASIGQFGSGIISSVSASISSFVAKISSGISQAIALVASLPGKAKSALGNLAGLFVSAGGDMIRGLISGINSAIGSLVAAAANAAKSALNAAKHALGINSPSRVFRDEVGVQIGAGLVAGIAAHQSKVDAAIAGMVSVPQIASVRATAPSLVAGASGTGAGVHLTFGDSYGVDDRHISMLAGLVATELARAQYMNTTAKWS